MHDRNRSLMHSRNVLVSIQTCRHLEDMMQSLVAEHGSAWLP